MYSTKKLRIISIRKMVSKIYVNTGASAYPRCPPPPKPARKI